MEKKTNNTTSIRNVYFTDLNHIKSIYHQNTKLNKLHIGEDFGLPLALIETKGEVIAYATIIFNNQTAPEICIKFKSEAEQEDYKQSLHQYAGKVLESMQSEGKGDYNKLEPYIQRLVDWLNLCN